MLAAVMASALLLGGCSPGNPEPGAWAPNDPPNGVSSADDVVAGLVAGLQKLDLTGTSLSTPPSITSAPAPLMRISAPCPPFRTSAPLPPTSTLFC